MAMTEHHLRQLIRKQDWHYEHAGSDWRDGLLLGNGNLGVMAYAPSHFEWVVNKVDVFDPTVEESSMLPHAEVMRRVAEMNPKNSLFLDRLESPGKKTDLRNTLSAAILRLKFWQGIGWAAPATPKICQKLSLYDGELTSQMDAFTIHPELIQFVPRNESFFCFQLHDNLPRRSHILELLRPQNEKLSPPRWERFENGILFSQKLPGEKECYAAALAVKSAEGEALSVQETSTTFAILEQKGDAEIYLAVRTSFECDDPVSKVKEDLFPAFGSGINSYRRRNQAWWHDYWKRGWIDFGAYTQIQRYWCFGLYEMGSAFGKAPMPGLNGLSYGPLDVTTPGVGTQGYTHDQNAQIPMMAFFPSNRTEFVSILADTYLNRIETLRAHTQELFGCPGVFLPLNTNQLGLENPTKSYRYTLCGSAYTGLILSFAWHYSKDVDLLREKLYPLLREFIAFYQGIMRRGKDGIYHLDWSVPPEIFTFTRDDTATISMLKTCLETAVEASEILCADATRRKEWKKMLAHYPEPAKRKDGSWLGGPDIPEDHYCFGGHLLYPFFPSEAYHDLDAAEKTVAYIESKAVERSFADHDGLWHHNHDWSAFLTTVTRLRLHNDPCRAWKVVERFLELFAKENGLFSHDPVLIMSSLTAEGNQEKFSRDVHLKGCDGIVLVPDDPGIPHPVCATPNANAKRLAPGVLEGNSAFVFLATETVLQSHNGIIRLFPNVPEDFTGSFRRLLAQGAFEISSEMTHGKVNSFSIRSIRGGTFKLRLPDGSFFQGTLKEGGLFRRKVGSIIGR